MKQHEKDSLKVSLLFALLAVLLLLLTSCASTYDGCKDPKSFITFMPEQCHANFNREKEWFE